MEEEKPSSSESAVHEEDGKTSSSTNGEQGWQTVTYAKRCIKSQPSKPSPGLEPEKSSSEAFSGSSNVFLLLEQAEERIRLHNLQESQKAAAESLSKSKPSTSGAAGSSSADGGDIHGEVARGAENKVEAKMPNGKKHKKKKITISDAAKEIDASALAAFLAATTVCSMFFLLCS